MMSRIDFLMQNNSVTAYRLCKETGIPQTTFSNWKRNVSTPKAAQLKKIADYFGVTMSWLMGDDAKLEPVEMDGDTVQIPVLGRVPAGVPIAAITEIEEYVPFTAARARSADFFALRIQGHSMEPKIEDGDIVIVRRQDECASGNICIVSVNGEDAVCKRVFVDASGVTLQSINPDYQPMHYSPEDVAALPVRIIGKVEEIRTRV